MELLVPEWRAPATVGTAALHSGWPPSPHQPLRPQALPTSSWMHWAMALCLVLMMASASCWIRCSEPSRLHSWRDTSHSVISGSLGLSLCPGTQSQMAQGSHPRPRYSTSLKAAGDSISALQISKLRPSNFEPFPCGHKAPEGWRKDLSEADPHSWIA